MSLFAGIGSIVSGLLGMEGQKDANRQNRASAAEVTERNIAEAQRVTAWQEQMSNTAHQREVKDLQAAGLNPILALKSGASTPGGSAGSGVAPTVENEMQSLIASAAEAQRVALETRKQKEEVNNLKETNKNIKAGTKKTKMETKVLQKEIPKAEFRNDLYDVIRPYIKKGKEMIQPSVKRNIGW